jgi:hypothetical protein
MSLILFFGLAAVITLVGFVFSGLVIRHHWRQARVKDLQKPLAASQDSAGNLRR